MQPGVGGSAVSSSNWVWGGAPSEIEFCTFYLQSLKASGNDSYDFLKINWPNLRQVMKHKGIS